MRASLHLDGGQGRPLNDGRGSTLPAACWTFFAACSFFYPIQHQLPVWACLGLRRALFELSDSLGKAARHPVILGVARVDNDHAFFSDDIFANILAVVAAPHFHHDQNLAKLAVDLDITHSD